LPCFLFIPFQTLYFFLPEHAIIEEHL
jgi:hypothetical protein